MKKLMVSTLVASAALTAVSIASAGHDVNGLVGYWNGDIDQAGASPDLSGHGNDGTPINGTTSVTGKIGQAFSLNDSGQYVHAPSFELNGPFTVSLWAKAAEASQDQYTSLFSSAEGSNTTGSFQLDFDGSGNSGSLGPTTLS